MRTVIVVGTGSVLGLFDKPYPLIRRAFEEEFGENMAVVTEQKLYPFWNEKRVEGYAKEIVRKHDDGEDLILVGHSFGGLIACAIANRFRRSRVCVVATIFSGHQFLGLPRLLSTYPERPHATVISFSAMFDEVILWGSDHPHATRHVMLPVDHIMLPSMFMAPWRRVARVVRQELTREALT